MYKLKLVNNDIGVEMVSFPIPDNFDKNACSHSAALFIVKSAVGFTPSAYYRNGTITFIECNDINYGVTCKHVVDCLRKKVKETNDKSWVFATLVNRTIYIIDRFKTPKGDNFLINNKLDIAIRQIHPDLPPSIGKKAYKLTPHDEPGFEKISHGISVGFPENEKHEKPVDNYPGYQVAMPCVHALAEKVPDGDNFTLYSELKEDPQVKSFSGMSGGPIFWTSEDDKYGLYGISYEASDPIPCEESNESIGTGPRIWIKGERITYSKFLSWIQILGIDEPLFEKGIVLKPVIKIELWD